MGTSASNDSKMKRTEAGWYVCENFWTYFEKLKTLGIGRTCEVVITRKIGQTDRTQYACKILKKGRPTMKKLFEREFSILKRLHHSNLPRLIGAYEDDSNFYLVMTSCPGGELFARIKNGANYNEVETCTLIRDLLRAIKHLHDQDIVHRDLKPENCLLDNNDRLPNLRLIDFGSAVYAGDPYEKHQEIAGTPYYMSPEAVRNVSRTGDQLKGTDMWSIGVITYVLLCGKPPFGGKTTKEIFGKILTGKLSWPKDSNWSDDLKDFLRRCITRNMRKRIDVNSALEHQWFRIIPEPGAVLESMPNTTE